MGQVHDVETGLYYNRFRYYDPEIGNYVSQDPIGLAGNNPTLYGYVFDSNSEVDVFGLAKGFVYGIHTQGTDFFQKGVHYGSHEKYPNGNKIEVSLRPDHKSGIKFVPSHPSQVNDVRTQKAFNKAVKEIEDLLGKPKEIKKLLKHINDLKGMFPDKGMEWKMLGNAVKKKCG